MCDESHKAQPDIVEEAGTLEKQGGGQTNTSIPFLLFRAPLPSSDSGLVTIPNGMSVCIPTQGGGDRARSSQLTDLRLLAARDVCACPRSPFPSLGGREGEKERRRGEREGRGRDTGDRGRNV